MESPDTPPLSKRCGIKNKLNPLAINAAPKKTAKQFKICLNK
jgi:hypothetical protein